jgi:hypothetical protein
LVGSLDIVHTLWVLKFKSEVKGVRGTPVEVGSLS